MMEIRKKLRGLLTMLLAAVLFLSACSPGKVNPAGTSSENADSAKDSGAEPLDGTSEKTAFLSLTAEEADSLFGTADKQTISNTDEFYFYFGGDIWCEIGYDGCKTVYRYRCDTGEIEYACRKSGCTHLKESDCPLFVSGSTNTKICLLNGSVIQQNWNEGKIEWYDSGTGKSRVFDVVGSDENCRSSYCYGIGNSIYYDKLVYNAETDRSHPELWRIDGMNEDPIPVAKGDENDGYIFAHLLDGEEAILVHSDIGPDGKITEFRRWIYRIDSESGQRSLLYEKSFPYFCSLMTYGNSFIYTDYDDTGTRAILHFVNLSTGEDTVVDEDVGFSYYKAFTDRCVLYLKDDPEEENAYIFHCYNYHTGERKEYPLRGDKWIGGDFFYYRGQVYFRDARVVDENGMTIVHANLVVWDILSGRQRAIYGGKIIKET